MKLILLLVIFQVSLNSLASTYQGVIIKKALQPIFKADADGKTYLLTAGSISVSIYLSKLSVGDYLSLEANNNSIPNKLTVSSVNYMGLKVLLGTWTDDVSRCYHFKSFTEFSISTQISQNKCVPSFSPIYTYIVNPSSTNWSILISGARNSYVGDLKFKTPSEVQIELFDSETGDTLKTLHLRK